MNPYGVTVKFLQKDSIKRTFCGRETALRTVVKMERKLLKLPLNNSEFNSVRGAADMLQGLEGGTQTLCLHYHAMVPGQQAAPVRFVMGPITMQVNPSCAFAERKQAGLWKDVIWDLGTDIWLSCRKKFHKQV